MAGIAFESPRQWQKAEDIGRANGYQHVQGVALGVIMTAFVNHGRWLARCPFCPSARMVIPLTNFWCADCGCTAVGGQEVSIVWPSEDDMALTEQILGPRPVTARNWDPTIYVAGRPDILGERLVEDLAVENLERGLPIPASIQTATEQFLEADWAERGILDEMRGFQPSAPENV